MTRCVGRMACLAAVLASGAFDATARPATSGLAQARAVAESIVEREEAASERAFDPAFRTTARDLLATLPLGELLAQTGETGLGLNALGDSQADLVYTPVTPCRIVDTRLAGNPIGAGTTRSFLVTGTDYSDQGGNPSGCGVPYGATTAAVVNFVAVEPAGPGNLQLAPYGAALPTASILNYRTGVSLANGLVVAICDPSTTTCRSDVTIKANVSATGLVADVQGYFRRVTTGGVGTALLADAAVTAPKISTGVVVRSLNSLTDAVTLAAANGLSVTQGTGTVTVTSSADTANTPGAIVARDGAGSFSAGSIALAGRLSLPATTSASVGVVTLGGTPFLHGFGTRNTFVGSQAGNATMTGNYNTAVGSTALTSDTTGNNNASFGRMALEANTTGSFNSAFGNAALGQNTIGEFNLAAGTVALYENTTGSRNTAVGLDALGDNTTGNENTALGWHTLYSNTTGSRNVAVGERAGDYLSSGDDNVYIANHGVSTESGSIRIGSLGTHVATYVAGIYGVTSPGLAVYVGSDGHLGTTTSSSRYKEDIAGMDAESDVLMKLRPVSFYYTPELDATHLRQYGLVAEEVAEVAPGLVAYDEAGRPQAVRYHFVNAMLLNEVQKQRRLIEAEEAEIRELRAGQAAVDELREKLARLEAQLAR